MHAGFYTTPRDSNILTGGIVALDGPELALLVSAALFVTGSALLVTEPRPSTAASDTGAGGIPGFRRKGLPHPLGTASLRTVLVVLLAIAAGTGVIEVAVAARAVHQADTSAAGLVLAAAALGSVAGGLVWGHRAHRHGIVWQLVGLGGLVVATLVASALAKNLVVLGVVLSANGAALSPLLVLVYLVVDQHAGTGNRTLVSSWANTTFNAGAALGATAGGAVVAAAGPTSAFLVGAGGAAVGVTLAVLARRLAELEGVHDRSA